MPKEPVAVIDGDHVSVYLYIVDAAGEAFAWEVVESRHSANEIVERKWVSEVSYATQAAAEDAGKLRAADVARGMA